MRRLRLANRLLLVLMAAVVLGVCVAAATGAIPGSDGTINACYATASGQLRVIDTEATPPQVCNSKERQLSWNQRGPAGPTGATGPAGPPGPASGDAAPKLISPAADLASGERMVLYIDGYAVFSSVHSFRAWCTPSNGCTIILADTSPLPPEASSWYQAAATRSFKLTVFDATGTPQRAYFVNNGKPSAFLLDGDHWQLTLMAEAIQQVSV